MSLHAALQKLNDELQLTERLPAADITQLQSRLLAALIAHHARHTPAFAARLQRARLSPKNLDSAETLRRLPTLARREIQNLGSNFFSREVPAAHQPVGTTITSGSTGEPVKVAKSAICRLFWGANTARDHRWHGRDVTGRLMSIRSTIPRRTEAADWGFPMAALGPTGRALGVPTAMDLDEHVRCIDEFQPGTLLLFPNVLGGLAGEWERRGSPPPSLRHIRTVGETVREELREQVRRVCNLPIEDSYSSEECGLIAVQCREGSYHEMSESVLVEVLDADGEPCEPGQSGRLVATDLRNFASPVIRYEIGDVAVRGGACRCGLPFPSLQSILGRHRNLLARPDGSRRYPLTGFQEFHKVAPVLQFRFIQHTLQEIELVVHARSTLSPEQIESLVKIVQTSLGYPFDVRITQSATPLPRSAGGKFEDFISRVSG